MAISEQRRQKKLANKKKKRKLTTQSSREIAAAIPPVLSYSQFPMHECLVPDSLFEVGIGSVIWARRTPEGIIAAGVFLVDIFCLGVKDVFFDVTSEFEYEQGLKSRLIDMNGLQELESMPPACARKLIEGAVSYADALGFVPHPDYGNVRNLFGDADPNSCPTEFTYGRHGKPYYVRGPSESLPKAKRIVQQLDQVCGTGNYGYLVASGG